MGDARLGVHRLEIKDSDTGGLTASAGLLRQELGHSAVPCVCVFVRTVVGIAMRGLSWPGLGLPFPIWGLT